MYKKGRSRYFTIRDHESFLKSNTYSAFVACSITGESVKEVIHVGIAGMMISTKAVVEALNSARALTELAPPVDQRSRFGNKAFRTWLDELQRKCKVFNGQYSCKFENICSDF